MEIKSTFEYGKFTLHVKNRKLNLKKIDKLSKAIAVKNLLSLYPVVINKKGEILDGQHRFEAAKKVNAEVFYVVSDDGVYDIDQVADTNNFQSHWKLDDYVNYYAKDGKEDYIKIQKMAKKYEVSITLIANLSSLSVTQDQIKNGTFSFKKDIQDLFDHARAIGVEYAFHFWNTRPFLRALKHIMKIQKYNKIRMGQKILANRKMLVKCYESDEYIKLLEEIYNTKATEYVRFL